MLFKLKILTSLIKYKLGRRLLSRADIAEHQQKYQEAFTRDVLSRSPFYARFLKDGQLDWDAVPVMDKTVFMDQFDEINTAGIKKVEAMNLALAAELSRDFSPEINGITVGLSTGTSGKRGIFLVSEQERANWAALMMHHVIKPQFLKTNRIAFFLRANSNLYSSVNSLFFKFKYYNIFQPAASHVADLNKYQPHILAAQPSVLEELAELKLKGILTISPGKIISFAEVLTDSVKKYITHTFGCPITEVYQCTEGVLGFSCAQGTMHLNESFLQVEKEYIEPNRFYPIITDFSRVTQPIVRYKMTDILIEKQTPCACGSPLLAIEKIEGREDDVLLFRDGDQAIRLYPDLISRKIAHMTNDFRRYKVVQTSETTVHIYIEAADHNQMTIAFTAAFKELFAVRKIENIDLIFSDLVPHEPGSKYRRIQRLINPETNHHH